MSDVTQPESAPAAEESLEAQLERAKGDAQKYLDNWRRAEADFQNFKKRSEQERDELRRFSSGALIINLLPLVDDFERAFASIDANLAGLTWIDGLRLMYRKLLALLESAGVRPIESEGEKFDPRIHEVRGQPGQAMAARMLRRSALHRADLAQRLPVGGVHHEPRLVEARSVEDRVGCALGRHLEVQGV